MIINKKTVKAINADNENKRLKITFEDGTLGQLTFKQVESFYNQFYLPDIKATMPQNIPDFIPPFIAPKTNNTTYNQFNQAINNSFINNGLKGIM